MKVLFCTDGSKTSYNSIKNFSKWFSNFTTDIICAIDWSFMPDTVSVEDSEFALKCTNSADSILDYSENLLREFGIEVEEKIKVCGSTVDSILETCENNEYDYVVLGSNGKKGIQKWLGSVSQEIASVSKISTYISKDVQNAKKVLFALDNTDVSANVVKKALNELSLYSKDVYITTVFELPDYLFLEGNIDANWVNEVNKKQSTAGMLLLNDYEKLFKDKGISVVAKTILNGNPATEIIKYISKESIDLVICGVRNRKYLSKLLLSSVSKRILENTKSDVLIMK